MSASASLELESALQAHGDQLATELRLLQRAAAGLPVPHGEVCLRPGERSHCKQAGCAICCLLCCGKQLDQKCNDLSGERAYPTVVDAVRLLRAKVEKSH